MAHDFNVSTQKQTITQGKYDRKNLRTQPDPFHGGPGATDVFVTAADDLTGITTSPGIANRLTLLDNAGNLRQGPFSIIEFDAPTTGIASPVFRTNPGFIQGGLSGGGAREFVLPNLLIKQLKNVTIRPVP